MGCGDAQEKLENKIMEMNIDKIELQMERYKQMKLLGEDATTNKTKDIQSNTVNNGDIISNNNLNIKRKTIGPKTTKTSTPIKTGKGRRSKSVKTARIKSNFNNNNNNLQKLN